MIAFAMIVIDERRDGSPEMALAERNHPIETFFLDGSHEALRVRIRVRRPHGRQHDANPRSADDSPHVLAPFPIAVAEQDAVIAQQSNIRGRSVRLTWRMNSSFGCGVDPTIWTRRDARSITNTV
jgi:hypothetical protein